MYYKKYVGERIYLSPTNVEDFKIFTKWVNDETLARGIGNFNQCISEVNEKEWLEKSCKSSDHNYSIIRLEDDQLIGSYALEAKDHVSRRYHIGGLIGEPTNRSKGYGTEALKLITKYAFEILNAETVYSGIYSFNEASLKSAKKAGYTVSGKFRNSKFYNGEFHDEYSIEITRDDYLNLKKQNLI